MWSSSLNSLKAVKGFTHFVIHMERYANVCYYKVNVAVSLPSTTNLIFNIKCTCTVVSCESLVMRRRSRKNRRTEQEASVRGVHRTVEDKVKRY